MELTIIIAYNFFTASIIVTPQDLSLALNSFSITEINFINVNAMDDGVDITVVAGEKVSIKCGGFGNGKPTWTWHLTKQYIELINATSLGLVDGVWPDDTDWTETLTGYVSIKC